MKQQFNALVRDRHQNLRGLQQRGRKIIGYFCSYCPEEMLYAAGLVPVRVLGGEGPYSSSGEHLYPYYCAYSHGCLNEGLKGDCDYLEGLVYAYTCEHTRGAFDSWRVNLPTRYVKFLDLPSWVSTPQALDYYVEELKEFQRSLEKTFGRKITRRRLTAAIEMCNRSRALLREVYRFLQAPQPVLSGAEVFSLILSSMVYPKEEHNQLLSRALGGIKRRKQRVKQGRRVMVLGTDLHEPRLLQAIEEQGAVVVADELCTGSRYIWEDVRLEGDPLEAIARRYLSGVNCPVKHPAEGRLSHIDRMLEEFRVERVLFLHPRHCDPVEWSEPLIKQRLSQRNIPWAAVEFAGISVEEDVRQVAKVAEELLGG
jgi:benzoyl-CoA reductase subunit C